MSRRDMLAGRSSSLSEARIADAFGNGIGLPMWTLDEGVEQASPGRYSE